MMRIATDSNNALSSFEHDVNLSASTKLESLKFLAVVLKNLDKEDPKYRQLRLGNAKVQRMTGAHPAILVYLQGLGFQKVQEDGESLLRNCDRLPADLLASERRRLAAALERLPQPAVVSRSSSVSSLPELALTEKQKARKLAEEREAAEKEAERAARKRTIGQIRADKHVRENDPNWKPSVSAAAAKAGSSMSTFRDKFGEN